jgi:hypothetical protein
LAHAELMQKPIGSLDVKLTVPVGRACIEQRISPRALTRKAKGVRRQA